MTFPKWESLVVTNTYYGITQVVGICIGSFCTDWMIGGICLVRLRGMLGNWIRVRSIASGCYHPFPLLAQFVFTLLNAPSGVVLYYRDSFRLHRVF